MKKILSFAVISAAIICLASCSKEPQKKGGKDDNQSAIKREWRIKTLDDKTFTYDAQGRVATIVSEGDNRVFTYSGSNLTIKDNGEVEYEIVLNADGFATSVKNAEHSWTIKYDKDGYMIEASQDGTKCTSQSIEDGNIMYWTRYDKNNDFWRMKDATYLSKKNLGCIQTHWAEDLKGFSRWTWEARLFGNTSVDLLESCVWHNFGDVMAEKTAVYTYEFDANGVVTKETKWYGVWNETDTTGMDLDDEHNFTWEKIK